MQAYLAITKWHRTTTNFFTSPLEWQQLPFTIGDIIVQSNMFTLKHIINVQPVVSAGANGDCTRLQIEWEPCQVERTIELVHGRVGKAHFGDGLHACYICCHMHIGHSLWWIHAEYANVTIESKMKIDIIIWLTCWRRMCRASTGDLHASSPIQHHHSRLDSSWEIRQSMSVTSTQRVFSQWVCNINTTGFVSSRTLHSMC